jgi:N-acetylneuraminic acid mutarotase
MVGVINGRIYVAGGFRAGVAVADFSAYNPLSDSWTKLAPLPVPRDAGMGVSLNGKLYAIGGRNTVVQAITARVDVFDPISGAWSPRTPMPTARGDAAAGVVNGRIVVAGGEGNLSSVRGLFDRTERFDPVFNLWEALPPMRTPRHGAGGATVDDTFYVPGGGDQGGFSAVSIVEAIVL